MAASSRITTLRNGHTIQYDTYGSPSGFPVFFFHGFFGSSHQASLLNKTARKYNLQIIAPNRAGIGKSSFVRYETILQAAEDMSKLLEQMNIASCAVLGFSSGAPFALALAYLCPDIVQKIAIIGALAPLNKPENFSHLKLFHKCAITLVRYIPTPFRIFITIYSWLYYRIPSFFQWPILRFMATLDETVLGNRLPRHLLEIDLQTIFCNSRSPGKHVIQELSLLSHWGFALQDIPPRIQISIWHGTRDTVLPPIFSKHVSQALHGAELHLIEGGHLAAIAASDKVLAFLSKYD